MSDSTNPFGDVIHSYTRAQAIRDGVLVDLTTIPSVGEAWIHPIACTSAVWGFIISSGKDPAFVCHMVATAAFYAGKSAARKPSDTLFFSVPFGAKWQQLKLHCGPGDAGEPVLTLMLPHED